MEGGTEMKYAGADWLSKSYPELKPSPLGLSVADMLGMVWNGLYHLDPRIIKKTNWADSYCISVLIRQSLSTADWENLTELVILCHDFAVRMDIAPTCDICTFCFISARAKDFTTSDIQQLKRRF